MQIGSVHSQAPVLAAAMSSTQAAAPAVRDNDGDNDGSGAKPALPAGQGSMVDQYA